MEKDDDLKELFCSAADFLPQLVSGLNQQKLLRFYALYKQATVGICNTPSPYWYAFEAKKKWDAWKALGGMSQEDSMRNYIHLMNEVYPNWNDEREDTKNYHINGVSVSRMKRDDNDLNNKVRDVFDFVKEGNIEEVKKCLESQCCSIVDTEGMSLLHWAADRGHLEIVRLLLDHGLDIDMVDADGQTPLHYACSCGHLDVARLLIERGCSTDVVSVEGFTPRDLAENELKILF